MNELEKYKQEVNIIFSCLEKLNNAWPNQDNINYINNLNEYKKDAIEFIKLLDKETKEIENDR